MLTKRMAALALAAVTLSACFTEADYHPYSGVQGKNPTATGSFIDTKYAVPTYYGYPPRPYRILGEMDTPKPMTASATRLQPLLTARFNTEPMRCSS